MFVDIESALSAAFEQQLQAKFQLQTPVLLEQPKQSSFGELAIPVAFQLARQLKRSPRAIAEALLEGLQPIGGIHALEVAGNGYINVRLDRQRYAASLLRQAYAARPKIPGKIVVEHTNINPNKAAHIGHLRNAILGDTFVRMLRRRDRTVEVQNYIDNTGVQVADVVVGFHYLEQRTLADLQRLIDDPNIRFDYLCWDVYAHISSYYKEHQEALLWRSETLHEIESGLGEVARMAHIVADAIVQTHIRTMYRLGVEYDVLPRESEILHLHFWATAFRQLKDGKAIYFEEAGKNKGCWVMPASAFREGGPRASTTESKAELNEGSEEDSKVIVRSNGTVTYVGKDIAYQLWKFGLLQRDFYYRPWSTYPDGRQLWVSSEIETEVADVPEFGHATTVYNVIDSRQSYLQDVVVAGLRALQYPKQADASIHFSYEMVALTPRTCVEMGIVLSDEEKRRAYVEVSGRKGLGVKADDLIDKLIETAAVEVHDRHPEAPASERRHVAEQIATGALRYFMLKFTRNSLIAFDFHEALSFEGETGPYVQYAAVRANNILRKWAERTGGELPSFAAAITDADLQRVFLDEGLWQLLLLASKADSAVERAIQAGEPAHVAKYSFQLAQAFNVFYHEYPVINEENEQRRSALLWLTSYVATQLTGVLRVLGISQPIYM